MRKLRQDEDDRNFQENPEDYFGMGMICETMKSTETNRYMDVVLECTRNKG